ncbi:histidine phosphotransferase, partial [Hymenopellis radicata]
SATIDMEQFNQILDLDGEDPECEFSASMVGAYFDQATNTFKEMEEALTAKNLAKLSELGHFLKGSSAQLGVSRVQVSCEKIQHYGQLKDQEKNIDLTDDEALDKIGALMDTVKFEYDTAEEWLKDYFKQKGVVVLVGEAD